MRWNYHISRFYNISHTEFTDGLPKSEGKNLNAVDELFILDKLDISDISKDEFFSICNYWFYDSSDHYPLSFEISKRGYSEKVLPMVKIVHLDGVKSITGHIFCYNTKQKIKKRKARIIKKEHTDIKI